MSDRNPYHFELRAAERPDEGAHQLDIGRGILFSNTYMDLNEVFQLQAVVNHYLAVVAPSLKLITSQREADHVMKIWAAQGRPSHPWVGAEGEQYCRRCAGGKLGIQHTKPPFPGDPS